jgi:hypothetical protein
VVSPWLIRNTLWTGNPVFPEAMDILGNAHFSDVQVERWREAYWPDKNHRTISGRIAAFGQQVIFDSRFGFLMIPGIKPVGVGFPLILAFVVFPFKKTAAALWLLLIFQSVLWVGFTHLQGRFMVMAIPLIALLIAQCEFRFWKFAGPCAAIAMIFLGSEIVLAKFQPMLHFYRPIIGIDNLKWAHDDLLENWPPDQPLNLVGDARAFMYPIPMRLLHYKTVFDVDTSESFNTAEEAWLSGMPVNGRRSIDKDELDRLSRTYYGIPPP